MLIMLIMRLNDRELSLSGEAFVWNFMKTCRSIKLLVGYTHRHYGPRSTFAAKIHVTPAYRANIVDIKLGSEWLASRPGRLSPRKQFRHSPALYFTENRHFAQGLKQTGRIWPVQRFPHVQNVKEGMIW